MDRRDGGIGVVLNGPDPAGDVLGGLGRLLGQVLDLGGDHGEALAGVAARAASMVAFRASRLVCSAMLLIVLTTAPISVEESPSFAMVSVVDCATSAARVPTCAASVVL
nr:hypothetical protein GCM10020093_029130 [Planobispora longispora]